MIGQWVGSLAGTNQGTVRLDLDRDGGSASGQAYIFESMSAPAFIVPITLPISEKKFNIWRDLIIVDPVTNTWLTELSARERLFPNISLPTKSEIEIHVSDRTMEVSWRTDIGTHGRASLFLSEADFVSNLEAESVGSTWNEFRSIILSLEPQRFVFRGQGQPWRLRTSFHRTSRKDLVKLQSADYNALQRAVSACSNFPFELTNVKHNAAFWHLVQHHGYPTPLLDWTYSPYIAAYFAFKNAITTVRPKSKFCRIHMLDAKSWNEDVHKSAFIDPPYLHASMLEALAYDNARAIPQQSLSMVTNVDDIESYIAAAEGRNNKRYIFAYDLPVEESASVIRELRFMGISPSSLFPGMVGACEDLKDRFFESGIKSVS